VADKYLIAPYQSGLKTDMAPWLLPEDAFTRMENACVFRGKIKKRFGSEFTGTGAANADMEALYSKARIALPSTAVKALTGGGADLLTDGAGAASGTVAGGVYKVGQQFSIGAEIFTVTTLGNPGVMTTTGAATTHTYDTTTGAFVFDGAAINTQVYFYPYGVGTTTAAGIATGIVPGSIYKVGQQFSIGDTVFTVPATGTMLRTAGAGACTFNTTTGAYSFTGVDATTQIFFCPSEPIMGITHYEKGPINEHTTYAFDTQFIYKYTTYWVNDPSFTGLFKGGNNKYFWSANWEGATPDAIALFTTNFNATVGAPGATDDNMYYYDNTAWYDFSVLTKFNSDQDYVSSAKMIINFKNRLLLLNTVEKDLTGPTNLAHTNRVRYSWNGSPFPSGVTGGHPWLEPGTTYVDGAVTYRSGGAGYLDAPVEEEIISAAIIKDRLIVFFERTTMELAYTGNEGLPFIWRTINGDLGSESTFSTVVFDSEVLTIGTTGVYACNGVSVKRIDENIPDYIAGLLKSSLGTKRVHGVKDYFNEMVYWTILDNDASPDDTFPNKILVYNYKNGSWSFNDDCITTFGYFEQSTDHTWVDPGNWNTEETWDSYYKQAQSRLVVAGNQQGFLFTLNNDKPYNASVLTVANFTYTALGIATLVIPNHNLLDDDYIKVTTDDITWTYPSTIFSVKRFDANTIIIVGNDFAGTYTGGGTVSRISQVYLQSKDWNPYISKGRNVYLSEIEFCVAKTSSGEVTVNYNVASSTGLDFVFEAQASKAILGDNIMQTFPYTLVPLESYQDVIWRRVYFQGEGKSVSIQIYLSEDQLLDPNIAESMLEIQGMILNTTPVRI
jgi:hypothetical protein